jgi:hypothetical protein
MPVETAEGDSVDSVDERNGSEVDNIAIDGIAVEGVAADDVAIDGLAAYDLTRSGAHAHKCLSTT